MNTVRRKRSYEAFLEGYKPAVLELKSSPYFYQLKYYPYICPFNSLHSEGCIFFQTEDQKQEYKRMIAGVEERSPYWHYIVGKTLGFPEKSVKWFSKMKELEIKLGRKPDEQKKFDIGISWAGFHLKSNLEWVHQEIKWMWGNYNHPKATGNPLHVWAKDIDLIEVPHGNFDRLTEVCEYIRRKRGLVPTVTNK